VRRFERDFKFNGFGHSRGPAVSGREKEGTVRLLVQGDSITWGQGIREEQKVYPALLLKMLQKQNPPH
jgi:lysophospholipase L1-like esterase